MVITNTLEGPSGAALTKSAIVHLVSQQSRHRFLVGATGSLAHSMRRFRPVGDTKCG
jgi:hypothetical protein